MPRTPEAYPTAFRTFSQLPNGLPGYFHVLPLRRLIAAFSRRIFVRHYKHSFFGQSLSATCLFILLITYHSSLIPTPAQSATATLSGTVVDQNNALVPNVSIEVINIAQGFQRSATTNDDGAFLIQLLPPGNYILKAEHPGFTPAEVRDITLNVNDQISIKIPLKVGAVTQTVQVVEATSVIDDSPAIATVIDQQFVKNLPVNARSFQSLIGLIPGVVITKSDFSEQGQFSVNGQRANGNYFTVDGVSANIGISVARDPGQAGAGTTPGLTANGGTNNLISMDALEEFKVQTSTYAAEFGRTPGAQVQLITRSGTNQFHGAVFEYFRNDVLEANDWFNNARGSAKPATRQNQFGAILGGPLYLPRFGEGGESLHRSQNRTFFFFSYEGLRLRLPQTATADVPSLAARQAAPSAVRPLLNAYPVPNGPNRVATNGQPTGFAAFTSSFSNPSTFDATSLRIDHIVSPKLTIFGRYNYAPSEATERGQAGSLTLNTLSTFATTTQTLTGGVTYSISPAISNELRANYSRNTGLAFLEMDNFGGAVPLSDDFLFPAGRSRSTDFVSIVLVGPGFGNLQVGTAATNVQRQFNIVNNLSIVSGGHQLKFGVDFRRLFPIINPQLYSQTVQFNGVGNPGAATQPVGFLLSGLASSATIRISTGQRFPIFNNLSLFGQDTWKLSRRLTLTYGLRWELNPAPSEANGNDALTVAGVNDPLTATVAPRGTPLWETTYNNFAPRIGVVYQVREHQGRELILRGGFGIFYDLGAGPAANAFGLYYPFTTTRRVNRIPYPLSPADALAPIVGPNPDGFVLAYQPEFKLPKVYQWNVSADQSLGANQSISFSYVGAIGRNLLRQERLRSVRDGGNLNPSVFLPTAQVFVVRNTATSDYHAFQTQFQRRLLHGLQALFSYTWSKSIDIASNDSSFLNTPAANINPLIDRGPSDFDVRHAFSGAITYNFPTLANVGRFVRGLFGHWSVDSIINARSATPVNVTYSTSTNFGFAVLRPDVLPGIPLYVDDPSVGGGRRINPAAFSFPVNPTTFLALRQGTLGRNTLRGFSVHQIDLALRRQFNLTEKLNLQFRTDFFNIFNHPNFADPNGVIDFGGGISPNPNFGRSLSMLGRSLGSGGSSGGFNPLYQIGGPRSIQFSLRLQF